MTNFSIREGFETMNFVQVHAMLTATYWTPGISREQVEHAASHSALLIGAFEPDGTQVGFARVVSDLARFAYLCDVVVAESLRGKGIGRAMIQHALEHPELRTVTTWMLATRDAHGVYGPLGFLPVTDPISRPADWMILRRSRPAWATAAGDPPVRRLHVVDAFTAKPYAGNPAAVCLLEAAAPEPWMKSVAREMNLSETAFLHPMHGGFGLRWFTPTVEVSLCGHATLASAFTLWETGVLRPDQEARFHTLSGWLTCRRSGDWIEMDFPAKPAQPCAAPAGLGEAFGAALTWVGQSGMDYLVEVADEKTLRALEPNLSALSKLSVRGIIVTSRSDSPDFDFVSRFFAPGSGVDEDPVTGSAHCTLGPYWQQKLGKRAFLAFQASARGGTVGVEVRGDRVLLRGQAVLISRVELKN
jgi:PhzF family phenazine biosynthesis protein